MGQIKMKKDNRPLFKLCVYYLWTGQECFYEMVGNENLNEMVLRKKLRNKTGNG